MSHSKLNKRGRSRYLENTNAEAQKYINECKICGRKGYSPAIEDPDFSGKFAPCVFTVNKMIYDELTKTYEKLELDSRGFCEVCAELFDKKQ